MYVVCYGIVVLPVSSCRHVVMHSSELVFRPWSCIALSEERFDMAGCAGGVELGTLDLHERKDRSHLHASTLLIGTWPPICYDHEETATKLNFRTFLWCLSQVANYRA